MNIIFKKISINNFLPVGKADINLNEQGFVSISAVNNYAPDNSFSNSSGKSAILDAIVWAITGETSRGTKQVKNRYTEDGTAVILEFDIDSNEYRLERYKEHSIYKTNLRIFINGEDKSGKGIRDSELILKELLPDITSQLLGSIIILGQGLPQKFSNNTPSGRKEILEKLSKSDFMIEDIKNRVNDRRQVLLKKQRETEDSLLKISNTLEINNKQLEKLHEQENAISLRDWDSEIVKELGNVGVLENSLQDKSTQAKESKTIVDKLLDKYKETEEEYTIKSKNTQEEFDSKLQPIEKEQANKLVEIKSLEQEITKLESIIDICPTCGQKIPNVQKPDTTKSREKLAVLQSELNVIIENIEKIKQECKDTLSQIETNKVVALKEVTKQGEVAREKQVSILDEIDKIKEKITTAKISIQKLQQEKELYNTSKDKIKEDINSIESENKALLEKQAYNIDEKKNVDYRLDINSKMTTLISRDFRGYLLKNIIEYINTRAKHYCKEIFDTDWIEFKLDGNDIYIGYGDNPYEVLSGGQKQKIDLIVQFSIRDMLSEQLGIKVNLLGLDEIFDNLDNKGCDRVVQLISNNFMDVSSVFIITHRANELMIPCDKEIIIEKNEFGVSYIKNE